MLEKNKRPIYLYYYSPYREMQQKKAVFNYFTKLSFFYTVRLCAQSYPIKNMTRKAGSESLQLRGRFIIKYGQCAAIRPC